jgi:hypothetical protein
MTQPWPENKIVAPFNRGGIVFGAIFVAARKFV